MYQSDLIGVLSVYIYVILLILITEKFLSKKYQLASRKILHIMVGNIAFLLPIFQTKEIMAFIAAGPFILFTFLMSPYSPIESMKGKTSDIGHGMGLVYYSITWTILAYLFFDAKEVIAIAILAMSYGDGFASIIGIKYGGRKYNIFGDEKSYVGSYAMFVFTFLLIIFALVFYGKFSPDIITLLILLFISLISTLFEGLTPKGLDNLSVPFVAAGLYYFLMVM
jgi:dolichol kinase